MRPHRIVHYDSILQVLGEKGCPFCAYLKNYQAALLQDPSEKEVQHLCSFHTWGLAATQNPMTAADLFLKLLGRPAEAYDVASCDICLLLRMEEDKRVREFVSCLDQRLVMTWLRAQAVLCIAHGMKVKAGAPPAAAATITAVMQRQRDRLVRELTELLRQYDPNPVKWGTLGRVAEFLTAQRGLHP